jgi:hypothetical protein
MMNHKKEILIGVTILVVILAAIVAGSGSFFREHAGHTPIVLSPASTGVHYDRSLQIPNATIPAGQWNIVSTSGELPPGLSVEHFEHGCLPTEPACPQNSFDLLGTPTRAGTWTFSVTFSIGGNLIAQDYQVQVLP